MMLAGRVLGERYRVDAPLGLGGTASAWRVEDLRWGETLTLKLEREGRLAELRREFALLTRLRDPRLPRVRDLGTLTLDGNRFDYLTTQYVPGVTWDALPHESWEAITEIVVDVLRALDSLHVLGLRHGDVKGANVIVLPAGQAVLIDLGMAQRLGSAVRGGTPRFMAPELERGENVDARADLYSLGVVLADRAGRAEAPMPPELEALHRALLSERVADRPRDAATALTMLAREPSATPAASPLVGRDQTMARIEQAIDACFRREAGERVLWIHGAPGSGRTRVLEEAKWRAQVARPEGARVVSVPVGADAIRAMLSASLGRPVGNGLVEALDARDAITIPTIGLVDDVDALPSVAREALHALLRTTTERDPVLWLLSTREPALEYVQSVELEALTPEATARWAELRLDAAEHAALHRLSGGNPAMIDSLLAAAHAGGLERAARVLEADDGFVGRVTRLPAPLRIQLARLAIGVAPDPESVVALEEERWAARDGVGARLARPADAARILASLSETASVRRDVVDELLKQADAEAHAQALEQLAELGDPERVTELLRAWHTNILAEPGLWMSAIERVADRLGLARQLAATLALALNDPERALRFLDDHAATNLETQLLRARILTALGRGAEALDLLPGARLLDGDWVDARVADAEARAHTRNGDRKRAYAVATHALQSLESDAPAEVRARLLEARGVAASYLGNHADADRALGEAEEWVDAGPADRIRLATYRGIDAYRRGDVPAAMRSYQRALELAESHRRPGDIARAALNLGSAQHQAGNLGEAFASYTRGERIARALDQRSIRLTLELDLGKLYTDAGDFDFAERMLAQVEHEAGDSGMGFLASAAASIRGENHAQSRRHADAAAAYARALAGFEALGARREVVEVRLLRAASYLDSGREVLARAEVSELAPIVDELGADDLRVRHSLLGVRLGGVSKPIAVLERALQQARALGQMLLEAQVHAALAREWTARGANELGQRSVREMRGLHERATAALPAPFRVSFKALHGSDEPSVEAMTSSAGGDEWRRLVQATTLLNEDLSLTRVLARTMDAAIDLTGAERGFVILRDEDGSLEVAAARNIDRERVPHGYLKFSRTIAEKAMQSAESIITTDAQTDDRFRGEASVHAMKLRSVLAVPIPSPAGILGALYLDNRFEVRRFGERQRELLLALANQVALAIRNARLVEVLEQARQKTQLELQQQLLRVDELSERLHAESVTLRFEYGGIVGRSTAMRRVLQVLDKVTDANINVLVQGESGTGKEVVARSLHDNGPRRDRPFVSLNCGALPDSLLESELFGHVKGAFTGAVRDRPGLFASADGGTLFLDEIGEMSSAMQVRLLRALQERRVRPVGSSHEVEVDVRVVAATNRNLRDEVERGRFREDLYYRLNVVEVELPPLRERAEDIPLLTRHFLERLGQQHGREVPTLSGAALRRLVLHDWPGNVRELLNVLERAFVMADGEIEPTDLALPQRRHQKGRRTPRSEQSAERARIREALLRYDWNVVEVSRALAIPRSSLYRKLARYGLQRPS